MDDVGDAADRSSLLATIPELVRIRVCNRIEPEPDSPYGMELRYDTLTSELPLAGSDALQPADGDGTPALTHFLRREAPWLSPAIERIDAQLRLSQWAGRPWISFRPLLLVGAPGSGKSHLARLIARRAKTGYAVLDLAGASDNRALEGTARGWTSAQPCFPAVTMNRTGTANPVIVLDEIDKAGGNERSGDPLKTILAMTERSTARCYFDKCLLGTLDLSHLCWIATANDVSKLPSPLISRFEVVSVATPGPEHLDGLFRNLLRDLAERLEMPLTLLPTLPMDVEEMLCTGFARHGSVRKLSRDIERIVAALIRGQQGRRHN